MNPILWIKQIPLWGVFFLSVAMVLVSIWIGTLLDNADGGNPTTKRKDHWAPSPPLCWDYWLLCWAFTFGIASELFQTKRQLLLDEVNATGTAFLRAGLLLEPHRSETRKLLSEYVNLRIDLANKMMQNRITLSKILFPVQNRCRTRCGRMRSLWRRPIAVPKSTRCSSAQSTR